VEMMIVDTSRHTHMSRTVIRSPHKRASVSLSRSPLKSESSDQAAVDTDRLTPMRSVQRPATWTHGRDIRPRYLHATLQPPRIKPNTSSPLFDDPFRLIPHLVYARIVKNTQSKSQLHNHTLQSNLTVTFMIAHQLNGTQTPRSSVSPTPRVDCGCVRFRWKKKSGDRKLR
jgi:hypothetical protein